LARLAVEEDCPALPLARARLVCARLRLDFPEGVLGVLPDGVTSTPPTMVPSSGGVGVSIVRSSDAVMSGTPQ